MSQRIVIEIVDKVATCLTKKPLVCGNSKYKVEFVFDEEWDEHPIKTAVFNVNGTRIEKVFEGNVCKFPVIQNALVATVGVFAGTIDDGTLSTSTSALVRCKSCATDGGNIPAPPPDDVYNQIVGICSKAVTTAKDVEERANNGDFNGEKGADGVGIEHIYNHGAVVTGYTTLEITLTNGKSYDIQIPDGKEGSSGQDGAGISMIDSYRDDEGKLWLVIFYDDGRLETRISLPELGIPYLKQSTGDSEDAVMSQKATTRELNERANALKGEVSVKSVVHLDDVSPNKETVLVKLSSKNLMPYPYKQTTQEKNGITFTDNGDGTITANGTATATISFMIEATVNYPSGTYMFSGCPIDGGNNKYLINLNVKDIDGNNVIDTWETGNGLKVTTNNGIGKINCYLRIYSGYTVDNLTFKPQLEEGTVATEYTPYVAEGTEKQISVFGKNLLSYPYIGGSQKEVTVNGVTFTDNGDGTITANGTATANARYDLRVSSTQPITPLKVGETYTYSGCPKGNSSSTYFLQCYDTEAYKNDTGNGHTFTAKNNKFIALIVIAAGTVCNNLTFKPQLERGAKATDYEPFYVKNYTTQVGSNIDIDSVSPNMTIKTDNTVLDVKYNKDANKVISTLEERIAALELAVASN